MESLSTRSRLRSTPLEALSDRYHEHQRERSLDFVYGGEERAVLFSNFVGGPGKRILDLGCRAGALTRSYLAGNEVVGAPLTKDRSSPGPAPTTAPAPGWAPGTRPR